MSGNAVLWFPERIFLVTYCITVVLLSAVALKGNRICVMKNKWNEKKIKSVLIDYLLSKNESNNIICSEVSFLSGKRWADILELKEDSLVAYEIKSDLDSLRRFKEQLKDYSETFNEVYVVLSRKFKGQERLLPPEIGYFWVDTGRDKRPLSIGRKARRRTNLKKENLSHFLWKKDISRYLKEPCENVVLMRNKFTKKNSLKYIHLLAIKALRERYEGRFELFLKEKSEKTHFSEIDVLTKKETSIC